MFVANKYVIPSGLLNAWHVLVWICDNQNMIFSVGGSLLNLNGWYIELYIL